jgi:hypothetical protein
MQLCCFREGIYTKSLKVDTNAIFEQTSFTKMNYYEKDLPLHYILCQYIQTYVLFERPLKIKYCIQECMDCIC